mgnify:CR=1 FL=1
MQKIKKEKYTLILCKESSFIDSYNFILENIENLKNYNIIIDLLDFSSLEKKDFLLFFDINETFKKNKKSLVLVNKIADIENLPETLNIAPTIIEGEDIIEMEEIERELGF